jgi:microcystin-dependent protein
MEGTIGEIRMFAGTFAPRGWAFCQSQLLAISQNTALFSILGTTYGGNGTTTFALPDFRGRTAVGTGQGPGLSNITLGEMAGTATQTLLSTQMPAHTHTGTANVVPTAAADGVLGSDATGRRMGPGTFYSASTDDLVNMAAIPTNVTIGIAGNSQPFSTMPPYLGMNYIICLQGIFPARD